MQEISSKKSSVLAGAVICVARKLADQAAKYETIVSSLGGQLARELGPAVTHFVFEVSGNWKPDHNLPMYYTQMIFKNICSRLGSKQCS
jgi:hypothetical protein